MEIGTPLVVHQRRSVVDDADLLEPAEAAAADSTVAMAEPADDAGAAEPTDPAGVEALASGGTR
ncbi:MAG TPA: hypothetical protein VM307_02110 [Egibacteraceae bacterium]|nr:hypothetical protein [Egibacteraceae bacterium]